MKPRFELLTKIFFCSLMLTISISAQTTTFTYQGNLQFSGQPANGNYDFEFALFDAAAAGSQLGNTQTVSSVAVANGAFAVFLDFGSQFPGANRFLEIRVRLAGQPGITILSPRQPINSTPYSVKSVSADTASTATTATNALSLGGVAANQYVLTGDARLSDSRSPLPNSPNYIQNTSTVQSSSNFNISGTGSANVLNAVSHYQLNGLRLISSPNSTSVFFGFYNAPNNTGQHNSFFGYNAGALNVAGESNSFFGSAAGSNNGGTGNSFFGAGAGFANIVGTDNAYFGKEAGLNATANSNSFFGAYSGYSTSGDFNAFFGLGSGASNTSGAENTFVGNSSGNLITTGSRNTMIGTLASGTASITNATAIGWRALVTNSNSLVLGSILGINGAGTSTNVGIGTTAPSERLHVVGNALLTGNLTVNGSITGNLPSGSASYIQNATNQQASSNFNISGTGTANIFNAGTQFQIGGSNALRKPLSSTLELGQSSDQVEIPGSIRVGYGTGSIGYVDLNNGFNAFYRFSGTSSTDSPIILGRFARGTVASPTSPLNGDRLFTIAASGRTGVGWAGQTTRIEWIATEDWASGAPGSRMDFLAAANGTGLSTHTMSVNNIGVGIKTTTPTAALHIASNGGNIVLGDPGCPAGSTAIGFNGPFNNCLNYSVRGDGTALYFNRPTGGEILFREENGATQMRLRPGGVLQLATLGSAGSTALCRNASSDISTCSSSARYKDNISPFTPGLDLIRKLRPVSFNWKDGGMFDLGLVAEEVATAEPLLITTNDKGEVEGVKYDRVSVVLVNAMKEQQVQIDKLQNTIRDQHTRIDQLMRMICDLRPESNACGKN